MTLEVGDAVHSLGTGLAMTVTRAEDADGFVTVWHHADEREIRRRPDSVSACRGDGCWQHAPGTEKPEAVRVAIDRHGATVHPSGTGAWEVSCESHATHNVHPDRARQERRARTHNANWHPALAE